MATTSLAGARSRFFDLPAGTLGLSHCSRRAFALPPRPRNRRSRSPRRVAAARVAAPSRCCLPCCSCLRLLLCDCLRLLLLATAASCDYSLECLLMHCDCCCLRLYCSARCHSTATLTVAERLLLLPTILLRAMLFSLLLAVLWYELVQPAQRAGCRRAPALSSPPQ